MLKTRPLRGEWVTLFCIVSCSKDEKNIWEWYSISVKEEDRFCSNHIGHTSKETPQIVPLSLYLHHFFSGENKIEVHLINGNIYFLLLTHIEIVAFNIWTRTIHSMLRIPIKDFKNLHGQALLVFQEDMKHIK
jgi:hypothetical protein